LSKKEEMKLSINGLSFSYEDKKIFEGLSLNLSSKKISILIGRNGVGKSTLLRIIAGLEEQDQGKITFTNNSSDQLQIRGNISYLGHKLALKEDLSVQENINFWIKFYNCIPPYADHKELGIDGLRYQKIRDLSQGQRKKVALLRILMADKKIWLLDEPLSNLDEQATNYFKNTLMAKVQDHKLILVTSHMRLNMKNESCIYIGGKA
jgi:heme exporter protein A